MWSSTLLPEITSKLAYCGSGIVEIPLQMWRGGNYVKNGQREEQMSLLGKEGYSQRRESISCLDRMTSGLLDSSGRGRAKHRQMGGQTDRQTDRQTLRVETLWYRAIAHYIFGKTVQQNLLRVT